MSKKLLALIITALMILSLSVCVYADSNLGDVVEDISYIEKVGASLQNDGTGLYTIKATVIGDSADLEGVLATLVLTECTFKPDPDPKKSNVTDIVCGFYDGKDVKTDSGRTVRRYTLNFPNMIHTKGDNIISFTLVRRDGKRVYLTKSFYTGSGNNNGGNNGGGTSSDTSSSDTSSKQIAALKPHLIVDSYSYGEAVAGQDVPLTFTMMNTSKNKIMRNIVLAVKPSGDLRIKSASDTIYIDSIDPGKTITKSLKFFLTAAAKDEVQTVSLTSTFEYFDIDGENAVGGGDTVTISLAADTVERVKIQKIQLPDIIFPNAEQEVSYSVINSGFATLYNAEIKVVDDAGTEYADVYVGSIEPSKAVTSPDLYLTFPEAGEKNMKFILSYENDKLQVSEVSKDFKAVVQAMQDEKPPIIDVPMPGESMPGEEKPQNPFILWGIIGGGVLVLIIAAVIIVKVVKKKRREHEDEDI